MSISEPSSGNEGPTVGHWELILLVSSFAYFATRLGGLLHSGVGEGLFSLVFGARFLGFYWPWLPLATTPSGVPQVFLEVINPPSTTTQLIFSLGGVGITLLAGLLLWLWLNRQPQTFVTGLLARVVAAVLILDLPTALVTRAGHLRFVETTLRLPSWLMPSAGLVLAAVFVWFLSRSWLRHLSTAIPLQRRGRRFVIYLSTVFVPFFLLPQISNLVFGRFDERFFRTGGVWACLLLALAGFLVVPKRFFASAPLYRSGIRRGVLLGSVAAVVLASWGGSLVFGTGADYYRIQGLFWGRYSIEQPAYGNLEIEVRPDGSAEVVMNLRPRLAAEAWWQKLYRTSASDNWRPYLQAFQWHITRLLGLSVEAIRGLPVHTSNDPETPFYLFGKNTSGARSLRATVPIERVIQAQDNEMLFSVRLAAKREVNWEQIRIRASKGLEIESYEATIPPLRVPRGTMVGETVGYLGLPDASRTQPTESSGRDLLWQRTRGSEMPASVRIRFRLTSSEGTLPLKP